MKNIAISQSEQQIVLLPMNFSKVSFTLATFDNFDHNYKSTTPSTSSTHDTVSVLFQEIPPIKESKPTKSEISLENVNMKVKLQCQEVILFSTSKHLNLPQTFTDISNQLHLSAEDRERYEKQEFILDCVRNIQKPNSNIPTWPGCKSPLSKQKVSIMQVGFIPFIPRPVTDRSTVYTAIKNFNIVSKSLNKMLYLCFAMKVYLELF